MSNGTVAGRALDDGLRVDDGADVGDLNVGALDDAGVGVMICVALREIDGIDVLTAVGEVLGVTAISIGVIVLY